jgi:hypothetical protein
MYLIPDLCSFLCTGPLPGTSWASGLQHLEKLYVQNNSLTGQLPSEWFNFRMFPSLLHADLRWNRLQGPVPILNNGKKVGPALYIAPMDEGFSLCVEGPTPRQVLRYANFTDVDSSQDFLNSSQGGHGNTSVAVLPSCQPGMALNRASSAGMP